MSLHEQLSSNLEWEIKYALLIEAGKHITPFPDHLKLPSNKISGCNAPTWILITHTANTLTIVGYSKSHIVMGLIALLAEWCEMSNLMELIDTQDSYFDSLNINELITPTRQNGFEMIKQAIIAKATLYVR